MKNNEGCFMYLLILVVTLVLCMLLTKAVVNSDLPLWLKVF